MAEVKAFRALRFTERAGDISQLCCPPYDIISDSERREYLRRNENNIIRLELPRETDKPYEEAARVLGKFYEDGVLEQDEQASLYIYSERFTVDGKEYSFKGVIARVKIEEFSKGVVLPHEETLSKAKADRFNLMDATMCNFSQIYSLYKDDNNTIGGALERLSADEPVARFTDGEGVEHSLWVVSDAKQCAEVCAEFADKKLYIADGHHRYETALNFRNHLRETGRAKVGDECDYVMMMLVSMDDPGLVVFPTHRIVRGLDSFNCQKVLDGCADCFDICELGSREEIDSELKAKYIGDKKAFGLYTGEKSYILTLNSTAALDALCKDCSPALKGLDVNVLHTLILERVLGIDKENMAKQLNLTYTRSTQEAFDAVDSAQANCCFIMNPTKVREISEVATAGEKMPQKSTYFYPKLITGLVMNKFGEI